MTSWPVGSRNAASRSSAVRSTMSWPDSLGRPAAPRSAQTAADRIRQRQQEELNNRVNEDTPEEDDTQKDEDDQPDPDDNN